MVFRPEGFPERPIIARMTVGDLVEAIELIAPVRLAQAWDRVGLQVGSRAWPLDGPVLLTLDLTAEVLEEAISLGARAIVAYHPPIFEPLTHLTDAEALSGAILRCAQERIAVYSPHTALDAAPQGLCDWLAGGVLGGATGDVRALEVHEELSPTAQVKVVSFVPAEQAARLRDALASAGAGIIGAYSDCSFAILGEGTFLGAEGTKPAAGRAGTLERVGEIRLEMVCSKEALPLALQTLRRFHPYEQPAVDVYPLAPQSVREAGAGRRVQLDQPLPLEEIARRLRAFLGVGAAGLARGRGVPAGAMVRTVGLCPGSGRSLAPAAAGQGCELYVTGEMGHHDVLACTRRGVSVLLCGHAGTERPYLGVLARRLAALRSDLACVVSRRDGEGHETIGGRA